MPSIFLETSTLVFLATGMQALGFLCRNQIMLRVLVLIGSGFYILYYIYHASQPLWDAVLGSSLIALANLIGLVMLLFSRLHLGMQPHEREVFEALGALEPGMFRALMRHGTLHDTTDPVELTVEGRRPDKLYYVLRGRAVMRKGITSFRVRERVFVGEIGWLLSAPASATATLPEGGVYVAWDLHRLSRLCARRPSIRLALDALISRDVACKLATGVQTDDLRIVAEPDFEEIALRAAS